MKRRDFIRNAGGATAALGAGASATAGTAAAQEGGGVQPDFGGYIDGAQGGDYQDLRGESEVTVDVGGGGSGLAFLPTGMWIDAGTTVTFEWSSGGHNVLFEETPSEASVSGHEAIEGEGFSFQITFDAGGIYKYYCEPHQQQGMLGAIAVGEDVPTVDTSNEPKELHELGAPIQAHWVGSATVLAIIVSIIFTFYVLKYGESANTGTGRR
ncbi:plastocyanin/azurin family copper-binding protein [Halorarum salinum]|uniref:Halocyanin n=1 Tax=Halorarum salinum TaxID=2743089 RepID=A0A7D5LC00_9EURY|nr:plastocyanin/azurin family copper-binding protein [Halobaculum salinum]QLG63132.1 halocyanin [Halobaculum salinum]